MTENTRSQVDRVLVGVVIVLSVIVVLLVWLVVWEDGERMRSYEDVALQIGLVRFEQECRQEGIATVSCDTMTGSAFLSDTGGDVAWIVYGHTQDPNVFTASAVVFARGGEYEVSYYSRDYGSH